MIIFKRKYILAFVFSFCLVSARAQNTPIGYWESFLPYNSGVGVATDGISFYVAGNQGFFTFDPSKSPVTYSKVTGMSDIGMQCVAYDVATSTAILVYTNGNIDLFRNEQFYNIPDLRIKSVAGLKEVYQVYAQNGLAYLSTSLGVLVIDITNHTILSTYQFINPLASGYETVPVKSFIGGGSYFYAATTKGLYRAKQNSPQLQNFQIWEKVDSTHAIINMARIDTTVFFADFNKVYTFKSDTLSPVYVSASRIKHLDGGYTNVFVSERDPSVIRMIDIAGDITDSTHVDGLPMQVVQRGDSTLWVADSVSGLQKIKAHNEVDLYIPEGPADANCYDIYANNKELWIAHGGFTDVYSALFNHLGLSHFKDNRWSAYRQYVYDPFYTFTDFSTFVKDETTGTLYMGSYLDGLFILNADGSHQSLRENSIFDSSVEYFPGYRQVVGMALDQDRNLWVSTLYSKRLLYVKTADSNWYGFKIPNASNGGPLVVDDNGQIWMGCYTAGGVVVYNTNGTISDPSDDMSYHLSTGVGFGNLPSNNVFCLVKDKNNQIWVGTDNGIGIISNCSAPFTQSPPCDGQIPIVQYDQYAGYLFAGNNVRCMAVDGANRKWIGTDDGLWLLSADAGTIIYRFTKDNSPLPANRIRKITVDKVTGEVYIGTDNGLVSYRSTATEGAAENSNVLVFPDPVPSGYDGTIAIKGLVANADVRITDIGGQLVYRTKALGGQAVWNGKDYKGRRPQSGVYLIFVSNSDGSQTYSGKMVFLQ